MNPTPSFLLCTSCQAQSASPSTSQLFVLVSLSQSLPPCPGIISAAPTTSPTNSPSLFPPACLSLYSALVGASISMKQFPPSHFLGKSSSTRRAGSPLPTQVSRVGARGVAAAGNRGPDGCTGMGVTARAAAQGHTQLSLPKVGLILMGNPKHSGFPKSPSQQTSRLCSKTSGHIRKNLALASNWNLREIVAFLSFLLMAMY